MVAYVPSTSVIPGTLQLAHDFDLSLFRPAITFVDSPEFLCFFLLYTTLLFPCMFSTPSCPGSALHRGDNDSLLSAASRPPSAIGDSQATVHVVALSACFGVWGDAEMACIGMPTDASPTFCLTSSNRATYFSFVKHFSGVCKRLASTVVGTTMPSMHIGASTTPSQRAACQLCPCMQWCSRTGT